MKNHSFFVIAAFLSLSTLSACGGDVKETLGLKRNAPDEFAVENRPSLDVPPEFKLRPPVTDGSALRESTIRDELRADILSSPDQAQLGSAEEILLQKTGAASASSSIRQTLNQEYGEDEGFFERIQNISSESRNETLVDAEKERERISQSKKQGTPISDGEVETRSSTGTISVLERIIGE